MKDFTKELKFEASRSSGSGGQNVNKVSTKVTLKFDVINSELLDDDEKKSVFTRLQNRINSEGILQLTSQSERSQYMNKKCVIDNFYDLLSKAFKKRKPRLKTKPTAGSSEKRLKSKKIKSEIKKYRKKIIEKD